MQFIAWDIETDTSGGYGLDPTKGGITSIAAAVYEVDGPKVIERSVFRHTVETENIGEVGLLKLLNVWMREQEETHGSLALVGWNSASFDAPFVFRRAQLLGAKIALTLVPSKTVTPKYGPLPSFDGAYDHAWHTHVSIDLIGSGLYSTTWADASGLKHGLKPVCAHFGINMVEVDRTRIHELSDGELADYNLSDIRGTALLFARLVSGDIVSAANRADGHFTEVVPSRSEAA